MCSHSNSKYIFRVFLRMKISHKIIKQIWRLTAPSLQLQSQTPWQSYPKHILSLIKLKKKTNKQTNKINKLYLHISRKREVLSKWMPFKTIISKNPSQVRMIGKEHPKHIPNFSFIPICCFKHFTCRIKWSQLISIRFNPNSRIVSQWQQVVYHLHNRTHNKTNNINGCLQYTMLIHYFMLNFQTTYFSQICETTI